MGKLDRWTKKLLSVAKKEVLIKAVIQAIPNYAILVLKFPKGFCEDLCVRLARFSWE